METQTQNNTNKCPECESDDVDVWTHEATFAVPECEVADCADCQHRWVLDAE